MCCFVLNEYREWMQFAASTTPEIVFIRPQR